MIDTAEKTDLAKVQARRERHKARGINGNGFGVSLSEKAQTWPTPMAGSPARGENNAAGNSDFSRKAMELAGEMQWQSPTVGLTEGGSKTRSGARSSEMLLPGQAEHWPTPASRDHKGANSTDHVTTNGTGRMHMDQLPNFVEHSFPLSPLVQAIRSGPPSSKPSRWLLRLYLMLTRPDMPTFKRKRSWVRRVSRRKLNPYFVEWLMGWPIGWTDFAPAGTALSPWLQRMRGNLSTLSTPKPEIGSVQGSLFDQ
ncbi:hypothetical protein [Erythrobacter rubeus]|uniref:hypothetical protein n=1 Tax=Erythrobacter rubeus TaxID=2760803 RepID=UPI001F2D1967|nr:hypothetical protein [Erythrobacter rubeus]